MKALAVGDIHIGHGADLGAPGERVAEQEAAWREALRIARDIRADCVLFAGDAWERRSPSPTEYLAFERPLIEHLDLYGPRVIAIPGNHDLENLDTGCALDVIAEAGLIDLHRQPGIVHVDGVDVCCLPWAPTHRLRTQHGIDGNVDEVNHAVARALEDTARALAAQRNVPAVLLTHFSVDQDARTDTGAAVAFFREPVLHLPDLIGAGFAAIVMGHIHRRQEWYDGRAFYVGSLTALNFGETGERGATILDVTSDGVVSSIAPIFSREFVTWDLDEDEVAQAIAGATVMVPLDGVFLKIRYRCTAEQAAMIDDAALRQQALDMGAHRVWVEPTVARAVRVREEITDDMTELDALDAYLRSRDGVDEAQVGRLLERAAAHIQGGTA